CHVSIPKQPEAIVETCVWRGKPVCPTADQHQEDRQQDGEQCEIKAWQIAPCGSFEKLRGDRILAFDANSRSDKPRIQWPGDDRSGNANQQRPKDSAPNVGIVSSNCQQSCWMRWDQSVDH